METLFKKFYPALSSLCNGNSNYSSLTKDRVIQEPFEVERFDILQKALTKSGYSERHSVGGTMKSGKVDNK